MSKNMCWYSSLAEEATRLNVSENIAMSRLTWLGVRVRVRVRVRARIRVRIRVRARVKVRVRMLYG